MDHKSLKDFIKKQYPKLRKPLFNGDPIRLFDEEYRIPDFRWLDDKVTSAAIRLADRGMAFSERYKQNISDCDNAALWLQAEVTLDWALNSTGSEAIAFGFCVAEGHALNIGVTKQGIKFWNYGVYVPDWNGTILEIEFK